MKNYLVVFEKIEFSEELKSIAEEIFVSDIKKAKNKITLDLVIKNLIPIKSIDNLISYTCDCLRHKKVFTKIEYNHKYMLDNNISMDDIIDKYDSSIVYMFRKNSEILSLMYEKSLKKFTDDSLIISLEDSIINKSKEDEFKNFLEHLFRDKFQKDVNIVCEYIPKILSEEEKRKRKEKKDELDKLIKSISNKNVVSESEKIITYEDEKKESSSKVKSIFGRSFSGDSTLISDIKYPCDVIVNGEIIDIDEKKYTTKKEEKGFIVICTITDYTDSIKCKIFCSEKKYEGIKNELNLGKIVKIKGRANYDSFENGELTINNVSGIIKSSIEKKVREDNSDEKRVELHCHSKMSAKDAIASVRDILVRADEYGMNGVAITDHGAVYGFPEASRTAKEINAKRKKEGRDPFKVIYGVEGYLVNDIQIITRREISYSFDDTFIIVDIETTGTNKEKDKIIEIGACKLRKGTIIERFNELIDPEIPIPPYITKLTGISNNMVSGKEKIESVIKRFKEFAGEIPMVAHNADFDMGFIRKKGRDYGIEFNNMSIDTVPIARKVIPSIKRHKLDSLAKYFKIDLINHHRAIDDAICLAKIFVNLIVLIKKEGITDAINLNSMGGLDNNSLISLHKYHIIILAKNKQGIKNLYKIISESHLKYLSGSGINAVPLIPRSLINKYRQGILVGSACEAGELYSAALNGSSLEDLENIASFYDYLEVQPLDNNRFMIRSDKFDHIKTDDDLIALNKKIIQVGSSLNIPVVATSDAHFLDKEDSIYRAILQSAAGYDDFDIQPNLSFKTTSEMLNEFKYLEADKAFELVVTNSNKIFNMCEYTDAISDKKAELVIENSNKDLEDTCYSNARKIYGESLPDIVEQRLNLELNSIIKNGYSVLYIIARKLVQKAKEDGYYVGSRGSVGSSFAATMAQITEINPLKPHYICKNCKYSEFESEEIKSCIEKGECGLDLPKKKCPKCGNLLTGSGFDIPFETFLGFEGEKEPDIDLNFSGDYQSTAHKETENIFGTGHTFRAGTISTINDKTAIGYVRSYFEKKGINKRFCEIIRLSKNIEKIRVTTGQHPGGIVVLPKGYDITDFTPVQRPANTVDSDVITTHFDYHSIDHNLLKLDILGHDNPTILKMLKDLTGINFEDIDISAPDILSLFNNTKALGIENNKLEACRLGCLGIPEMGTDTTMKIINECNPKNISDLLRISGLSHGTNVWENNAKELIGRREASLKEVISIRDDIMLELIRYGLDKLIAFEITESVRKGKIASGKEKRWNEWKDIMKNANIPDWYIWSCERIEYMFPKAHAAAYVTEALRFAYYKIHYPKEFYCAFFSIRAKKLDYESMCQDLEGTNYQLKILSDKIKKMKATDIEKKQYQTLRIIQEMQLRGIEFTPIDVYKADPIKFTIIDDKIMPSFISLDGMGEAQAFSLKEAADKKRFISIEDAVNRTSVNKTVLEYMNSKGMFGDISEKNQLSFL